MLENPPISSLDGCDYNEQGKRCGYVIVYFVARKPKCITKIVRRSPVLGFAVMLICLGRWMCRSQADHVSVGNSWIVLEVARTSSIVLYPTSQYILHRKGLAVAFTVPVEKSPDWGKYLGQPKANVLFTILKWMMNDPSLITYDCVETTAAVLRDCGLAVPSVITPQQLHDWLEEQGYGRTEIH